MASTEYDQIDNEYKPVGSAKQIEDAADRDMAEGARAVQEQRNREVQDEFERGNREREADEREFNRKLEKSRRDAEREEQQETLRKQQEARDLRSRKRDEQIDAEAKRERAEAEAIERQRDEDMAAGAKATNDAARRKREAAGKKFGFTPRDPNDPITKASLEREENEKMWDEFAGKEKERYAKLDELANAPIKKKQAADNPPFEPGALGLGRLVMRKAAVKVKASAKEHLEKSYNDMFLVPLQRPGTTKDKAGNVVNVDRAVRKTQPSPLLLNILGGTGKAPRRSPTGLLSVTSFADPSPLLFSKPKRAPAKKKKGTKAPARRAAPRAPARRRSLLDDLLF